MKTSICAALFFFYFIFSGCQKTYETKFKGRVVGDLKGEGIKNASISIHQEYQDNYREENWYGPKYANADGYYEFILEVKHYNIERFIPSIQDPSKKYTEPYHGGINMDGQFQTITLMH